MAKKKDSKRIKKITITNFIHDNEKVLTILGIFLGVFALSFDSFNDVNKVYAGYLALITCIISFLLILEMMPKDNQELSFRALLFLGSIIGTAIIIFMVIKEAYNSQYDQMWKLSRQFLAIGIGVIISTKLIEKIRASIHKNLCFNILIVVISILLISFYKYPLSLIANFLVALKITNIIPPEYIGITLATCGIVFVAWGILEVGIKNIIWISIYKNFILKHLKKFK